MATRPLEWPRVQRAYRDGAYECSIEARDYLHNTLLRNQMDPESVRKVGLALSHVDTAIRFLECAGARTVLPDRRS